MKRTAKNQPAISAAPEFFSPDVSEARRFYLDLTPPAKTRFAVVCGGCEHCTPDYAIHRTTFPFYSIEYVARGRGTVKLQGRTHSLQSGYTFSYGPGVRQDIAGDPAAPLVKYFVDFAGRAAVGVLRSCGLPPGRVVQVHPPHALQALFDELITCGLRATRKSTVLCGGLLECLALKLADARTPATRAEGMSFSTYEQCQRHMQQHFRRLRTLEQIAEECHINPAYLCRLFRRYGHQSPYQRLLRLKLNFAAELLQQPGTLVKSVAERIGFGDPFHFSRAFKNVFGLSPEAFRQLR